VHDALQWLGYLSPVGSVIAAFWAGSKAWHALHSKVEQFGRQLDRCGEQLDEFADRISNISERLARTEERVRGLESRFSRRTAT
jgi:uncharacterized protein YukE